MSSIPKTRCPECKSENVKVLAAGDNECESAEDRKKWGRRFAHVECQECLCFYDQYFWELYEDSTFYLGGCV